MKLAFTTLGCPDWDLDTIIARAGEYGFDGVDFRGYRGEMNIYRRAEFTSQAGETAQRFRDAGLEIPCFSSSARVGTAPEQAIEEVEAYLPLCEAFGAKLIRVFVGKVGDSELETVAETAAATLRRLAHVAGDRGITVAVETHDDWVASANLKMILEKADLPAIGALWDIHHPFRMGGESPQATWDTIGRWVRYTHVKDSYVGDDGATHLCLQGEGDVPVADVVRVLRQGGYDGWLTLEWEKKWHPEIPEAEVAFPRYVRHMRELLS